MCVCVCVCVCVYFHVSVSGLYETRESHNCRLVRRLRDMLLATLRMAGYQPRVTYQLLGLALRPSR